MTEPSRRSRVWILEDEEDCLFVAEDSLQVHYEVRCFSSLKELREALSESEMRLPDALVADLRLKDGNFLQFVEVEALGLALKVPIVITSSLYDSETMVSGYEKGTYDYLVKPFRPTELRIKVDQAIRKFVSDRGRRLANQLELTPKESRLLECLHSASPDTVSRERILEAVWGEMRIHPKTVDVHIHNLRKKLCSSGWKILSPDPGAWQILDETSGNGVPPAR